MAIAEWSEEAGARAAASERSWASGGSAGAGALHQPPRVQVRRNPALASSVYDLAELR